MQYPPGNEQKQECISGVILGRKYFFRIFTDFLPLFFEKICRPGYRDVFLARDLQV